MILSQIINKKYIRFYLFGTCLNVIGLSCLSLILSLTLSIFLRPWEMLWSTNSVFSLSSRCNPSSWTMSINIYRFVWYGVKCLFQHLIFFQKTINTYLMIENRAVWGGGYFVQFKTNLLVCNKILNSPIIYTLNPNKKLYENGYEYKLQIIIYPFHKKLNKTIKLHCLNSVYIILFVTLF